MEISNTALEIVDLLGRRGEILTCLLEEPRDKRTLVEELDVPRSTLDRAVRELETVDLVTYTGGEYAVTPVGEHLVERFCAFMERLERSLEFEPLLQSAPVDELDLDFRHLENAELLVPEPNDPYAMVNRHVEMVETADHYRGLLPLVGLHAFEKGHQQVVEHGARHEVIVEPGVVETLQSNEQYTDKFQELCNDERFGLSTYDGTIPYFVGVFDEATVQLGVDEGGEPRALLESDHPDVLAWARETIDEYRRQATPLSKMAPRSTGSLNAD